MNTNWIWGIVAAIVIVGGVISYVMEKNTAPAAAGAMGTYAYTCANGSSFSMTPSENMQTIVISAGSQGMFTGDATLSAVASSSNHFEGTLGAQKITFSGAGEEVHLAVGTDATDCNPVANADAAPWNWGDSGEGAGTQPDLAAVVGASVVGTWRTQNAVDEGGAFERQFKADGTVVDTFGGDAKGASATGTWKVFTSASAPAGLAIPLQDGVAYLQITEKSSSGAPYTLNFKVSKMTPEELDLTNMDRGGVLHFTAVK